MTEQTAPQFVDEFGGVIAPTAPPKPRLKEGRTAQRQQAFGMQMDFYVLAVVGVLCAIGLLMVYSASIDASFLATEDRSTTYFFRRQLFPNLFVGSLVMYILARIDYRVWRRLSALMMVGIIAALMMVLVFGDERLQAKRSLFGGSYQPGEAAKLVVVIYMAAWLASKRTRLRNVTYGLIPFSIMVGTVAILIILQPDISTAASILATALTMFFLAGANWLQISLVLAGALGGGWTIATKFEYAKDRIDSHLAAINNLTLANDHVQAAIVAFLDGGLFGVGLGEGRQKYAIPFPHTDSVFAVIGEELGLFGCFIVIALFVSLVLRSFTIARNAPDTFGSLLAAGGAIGLTYAALVHSAVMPALVPPTGVPLPFISFGGSSLVAAMAGIGLILSVSRVSAQEPVQERQPVTKVEKETPPVEKPVKEKKEKKEVIEARKARQRRRKEALEQSRQARPVVSPPLSSRIDDVLSDLKTADKANQEGQQDSDSDSDLGGGNGGGRISRISCG